MVRTAQTSYVLCLALLAQCSIPSIPAVALTAGKGKGKGKGKECPSGENQVRITNYLLRDATNASVITHQSVGEDVNQVVGHAGSANGWFGEEPTFSMISASLLPGATFEDAVGTKKSGFFFNAYKCKIYAGSTDHNILFSNLAKRPAKRYDSDEAERTDWFSSLTESWEERASGASLTAPKWYNNWITREGAELLSRHAKTNHWADFSEKSLLRGATEGLDASVASGKQPILERIFLAKREKNWFGTDVKKSRKYVGDAWKAYHPEPDQVSEVIVDCPIEALLGIDPGCSLVSKATRDFLDKHLRREGRSKLAKEREFWMERTADGKNVQPVEMEVVGGTKQLRKKGCP